ncbi:ADP-ribosylation factor GTPase-activating protein 2 isoform X4 [Diorhabda carinulata]|uniref:ADP-ribosylation factor GTPase-activating protein 2 isoform X4 n=1 Tax=Diorhabda carinulata TaxID=1163345 RepID=UPI0025A0898E|nr:ADP-ribosylation factor GTPase-activating protein 2 isoform X4 [Diorhabda carinulata]
MDYQPTKEDIEAVFNRLRSIPANKACFDCNAKNPTWASVTYGVFICIDCSAVHRGLGVHLTFVRSTQLDTNWTLLQLRQMQLGGNSNGLQFFSQHNCNTNDAQKKYNSRAAQLYREKLSQAAANSLKTTTQDQSQVEYIKPAAQLNTGEGPSVDFLMASNTPVEPRKSAITARKPAAKKSSLGAKKTGLGATKVKTNFAELEREAELAEEQRAKAAEEAFKIAALTAKEQEEKEATMRLVYKDIGVQQQKKEEQLRREDPKKAEQLERLGMGIGARTGVSHSAINDMQTIEQENIQSTSSTLTSLGKLRLVDNDNFMEDYLYGNGLNMNRNSNSYGILVSSQFDLDERTKSKNNKDSWVIIDDPPEKPKPSSYENDRDRDRILDKPTSHIATSSSSSDEAQKKFGNAKAISSDQFFNDNSSEYEAKANLSRFQGSSSISSAEFFGNGKDNTHPSSHVQMYDIDDVKESVRQGVTKVAGKLGSMANDLMSSLQERYGY